MNAQPIPTQRQHQQMQQMQRINLAHYERVQRLGLVDRAPQPQAATLWPVEAEAVRCDLAAVYALPRPGEDGEPLAGSSSGGSLCMALIGIGVLLVTAGRLLGLV